MKFKAFLINLMHILGVCGISVIISTAAWSVIGFISGGSAWIAAVIALVGVVAFAAWMAWEETK